MSITKSLPVAVVGLPELGMATGGRGIINLSSFDKCFASVPVPLLLVFDQPIDDPVETIKKALSQALVHYYPMAGRLVAGAGAQDGELTHIACTGEGMPFISASAGCALDQLTASPVLLSDLAVRYPSEYCRPGDALLLMQVTEFTCGGFVVGVTWDHAVADAAGMAQFLQAVGELARGLPAPSVIPIRSDVDGWLPCLPPSLVAEVRSHMQVEKEEMASLDVTVPWSLISRIKAQCGGDCTVFDAVAAVLWRCRTRAVTPDPDEAATLVFTSSMRGLVGAEQGYYGNCATGKPVQAESVTVASGDVKDLVKLIRLAKDTPMIAGGEQQTRAPPGPGSNTRYNTLLVTSWRNLGFDDVDFGRGSPARCELERTAANVCVLCPPCKWKDGVNVASLCVKPEHAHAFLRELELAALTI